MPWPRKSLFLALFLLSSPWVTADTITVNTTTDDNLNNSLCSLREAVTYFNLGKPEGGYQGCEAPASDSFNVIKLPADTSPYVISQGPIFISSSISFSGDGAKGEDVTTVQVQVPNGASGFRAFVINFDPSYEAPGCAPANCSPDSDPLRAPAPALSPLSDTNDALLATPDHTTDGAGDYLTFVQLPELTGSIPGSHPANHSYKVRIYDNPKSGEPVLLAEKVVAPDPLSLTLPVSWALRSRIALAPGVHFLTYTIELLNSSEQPVTPDGESEHSEKLTVAVYPLDDRPQVTFSNMVLKGGGAGCTTVSSVTCATDVDDTTTKVNDPLATASYDPYGLTYRNLISGTAGNGGVIFNNENLALTDVILQDGEAQGKGGGLYVSDDAGVLITATEIRENKAGSGAAVFAERNSLRISQSLVVANEHNGLGGTGTVVEVADSTMVNGFQVSNISSSTFSGNTGVALSMRDNTAASTPTTVLLENLTIVLNTGGGVDFNNSDVEIRNSIIAGNQHPDGPAGRYLDCIDTTTATIEYSLIVVGDGCPPDTILSPNGNQAITDSGNQRLMATLDANGRCNSTTGILCPLADHGGTTPVHMPRLLPSYTNISESQLINRAGSDCLGTDQRGEERLAYACDMGAVEVQEVPSDTFTGSGGSIKFGQRYEQFLGDGLADEELLPASQCPPGTSIGGFIYPPTIWADSSTALAREKIVANSYRPSEPGCPWMVKLPGRGVVRFERHDPVSGALMAVGQGYYSYRPNYNFHGFDRFEMRVVTTLSKLNPLLEDRSRLIRSTVIVEPGSTMASSRLGGALDVWGVLLLGMLGLGWRGRRQA
jgi:CSLREA domain-containing protein